MCFILCTYGISVCTSGCILQIFDDVSKIATVGLQTKARSSPEDMQQVNRDIFDSGTLGIPVERDFSCDIYSNEAVTDKSQITVISHKIFSNRSCCINSGCNSTSAFCGSCHPRQNVPRLKQNRSRGTAGKWLNMGEYTCAADEHVTPAEDDVVPSVGCRHHDLKSYAIQYHFM